MAEEINHKLVKMAITNKKVQDAKPWGNEERGGTLWPVGIEAGGEWHNSTLFSDKKLEEFRAIPQDEPILIMFFQEEYQNKFYNKFRIPTESDFLRKEVDQLKIWKQDAIDKYPDLKDMIIPE